SQLSEIRGGIERALHDGQLETLGAGTDGGQRVVDLVHDAGRQRTDRRELFGVRETHLRLAPFGDVLADGHDVRHLVALYFHWDFRYAIGALIAERGRFNGELLHLPRCEHALELAAQQVGGLPVKNFEYRAANGLFARNALHARLAFSIPRLNAIRP